MKRIITHPEETIYELVAKSDCLEFWKSMGFEYNRAGDRDDEYYLRKTCSYGLKQEIGGLAIIQSKGQEGIANRWGCILLPCQFEPDSPYLWGIVPPLEEISPIFKGDWLCLHPQSFYRAKVRLLQQMPSTA